MMIIHQIRHIYHLLCDTSRNSHIFKIQYRCYSPYAVQRVAQLG
jgi:hypothetical protein